MFLHRKNRIPRFLVVSCVTTVTHPLWHTSFYILLYKITGFNGEMNWLFVLHRFLTKKIHFDHIETKKS